MLEQGVGRRAWREKYPGDDWVTHKRQQVANGDRIALLRQKNSMRSAVLTFYDKEGSLHWVVHCDGDWQIANKMFDLLVEEAERHPWPAASYIENPLFGRF